MLEKVAGLAHALAILLAIVAGLVTIPGLDVVTLLIILGLISGITVAGQQLVNLAVAAVALPVVAGVLANLPAVGDRLAGIFENLAVNVAAAVAMGVAITVVNLVKDGFLGLGGGNTSS